MVQTIVGGLNGSDYSWKPKWFRPDYSWRPKSTEVMVKNLLLLVEASFFFFYTWKNGSETKWNPLLMAA